ncbi:DUF6514 family protein [Clostridium sp. D33t1_170424_F3]|uniref:DUF6514 family protein n=1 Tax=Clostridium sp. D33t1_170424_F3 TaxID=2787099 RepID=UPI0018AA5072|nr:DUF6514 family protein [Clostridium sp. D33t1_170424_F3]
MHYELIEETIIDPELGNRRTYGIAVVPGKISDISSNREAIEQLVELLNMRRIPLVHFKELVEDFLAK